jgi:hypothetical protein
MGSPKVFAGPEDEFGKKIMSSGIVWSSSDDVGSERLFRSESLDSRR